MQFRDLFNKKTWLPDLDVIFEIDEFKLMSHCPQSVKWHKEGNVREHTKLVTEHMQNILSINGIKPSDDEYYIMMMSSAICHDLGKPSTTLFDSEKEDYTTRNHGAVGARITRRIFFDEEIMLREKVCYMVRRHMDMHHLYDKGTETATRNIIKLSHGFKGVTVKDLTLLNVSDSLGSVNDIDTDFSIYGKAVKIKNDAERINCYEEPYKFLDDYQKMYYLSNDNYVPLMENPLLTPYRMKGIGEFTVYILIGVPGAGKTYYTQHKLNGKKVISRDIIRSEIGIKGEKPQGNKKQEELVTKIFNEELIKCCKIGKDFVIDNTNVRKLYRDEYKGIILEYKPKIVYIYIEAPDDTTNRKRREGMMSMSVIDKMWNYFDFPELYECSELIIEKQKPSILIRLKKIIRSIFKGNVV